MHSCRSIAIHRPSIGIDDRAVAVGAFIDDFFRDAEGARRRVKPSAPCRHIGPADVLIVTENEGLLLAQVDGHTHGATITAAMPDKKWSALAAICVCGLDDNSSANNHFLGSKRIGHLARAQGGKSYGREE